MTYKLSFVYMIVALCDVKLVKRTLLESALLILWIMAKGSGMGLHGMILLSKTLFTCHC